MIIAYVLFWWLLGSLSGLGICYFLDDVIKIKDIIASFFVSVAFGPIISIIFVFVLIEKYGDIVVFPCKRKYWFFRKGKSI